MKEVQVLTPKRWELLKHVHLHPAHSALSAELKRDDRRVHEDVETLAAAGLLKARGKSGPCRL